MHWHRSLTLALMLPALLLVACRRPEVEAFQREPAPLVVAFQVDDRSLARDGEAVGQEYAAALRARLATRATVVPERTAAPSPHVRLEVRVDRRDLKQGGRPDPAKVGVATGVIVGTLSAMAGNRDAFADGLWWGLWAGMETAHHNRHHRWWREVVPPNLIQGHVRLVQEGIEEPLWAFTVEPEEVLDAMDPLRHADKDDPQRVREEEARGFARVVVGRLAERFQWPLRREPSWFRSPEPTAAPEGPAREPAQP